MSNDTRQRRRDVLPPTLVIIFDRLRKARLESRKPTKQSITWRDQRTGAPDGVTVMVDFDRIDITVGYWGYTDPKTEEALAHARRNEVLHLLDAEYRSLVDQDKKCQQAETNRKVAAKRWHKKGIDPKAIRDAWQAAILISPGITPWFFWNKAPHGLPGSYSTFKRVIASKG